MSQITGSGDVLLLTGPPGSGKTTVAKMFAARFDRAVHLESDRFFHFIVQGYIEPWKPESNAQNELVIRTVGHAAASYAEAGYFTVVDGILIPGWFYEPLRDALDARGLRVRSAILRPPLDVALARVAQREPREPSIDNAAVEQLWNSFRDLGSVESHAVDNGDLDAVQTTSALVDRYEAGLLDAN